MHAERRAPPLAVNCGVAVATPLQAPPTLIVTSNNHIGPFIERIRNGEIRALSRAISAVEDHTPESTALLKGLFTYSGKALLLGITGSPGAGKSTLVDQIAHAYRKQQKTVGIVAVDPTSPFSGGAILGDRIRMGSHHSDPGIFIRSMATRGSLGGLASTTADIATVIDASGRDVVMIETVGVGQDEVEIVTLADVTVVVLVPGMGDDVQTIKAGIMEIADVFAINKADRPGAARVEQELRALQSLSTRPDKWVPPLVRTVATESQGIAETLAAIRSFLARAGAKDRAVANWSQRLREMLRERLIEQFANIDFQAAAGEVAARRSDPYTIIDAWTKQSQH